MNNDIGQMAIAIALLGFHDLGRLVTPIFLFENRFYLQVSLPKISLILQKKKIGQKSDIRPFCTKAFNYLHIAQNMNKKLMWEGKINSRFLSTGH